MALPTISPSMLNSQLTLEICQRATNARDPRFDGLFFVAITTTRVYCRPICPARVTYPERRRFFDTAAAAERAGFRPCLRCRPELAPGRAHCDAVARLAYAAAHLISGGALNERSVPELAQELGVSERHLRRALEREIGVSPVELALTHRLLLAKQLLADTRLTVSRIAYASGFKSLRRFNSVFRERYRMPPSALRKNRRAARTTHNDARNELLRLTLAYRAPFAWDSLLVFLRNQAIPGVELIEGRRYGRTVRLDGRTGVFFVEDASVGHVNGDDNGKGNRRVGSAHVEIHASAALVPVLMPFLARLRHFLDLDAQPAAIDAHLAQGGLGALVRQRPGLRIPGAVDGFDVALRTLLRAGTPSARAAHALTLQVVQACGDPIATEVQGLNRLAPTAENVLDFGAARLASLGVVPKSAEAIENVARLVIEGVVRLEPGRDVVTTCRALTEGACVTDRLATTIAMRTLHWPDAFAASDRTLQRAAGVTSEQALLARSEEWRPWRAYAALHLRAEVVPELRFGEGLSSRSGPA